MSKIANRFLQTLIRAYAFLISPLLGKNCRFHPTCSSYACSALEKHGVVKGLCLSLIRILKCNPWNKTQWNDPVPEMFTWAQFLRYKRSILENSKK